MSWRALWKVLVGVGGLLTFAASTDPASITPNLAGWVKLAGFEGLAAKVQSPLWDLAVEIAGIALLIVGLAGILWPAARYLWGRYQRRASPWLERDQLELYVIACLSVGKAPALPVSGGTELVRLRLLKDAIKDGKLPVRQMNGKSPSAWTTVGVHDLQSFSEAINNADLKRLALKWAVFHGANTKRVALEVVEVRADAKPRDMKVWDAIWAKWQMEPKADDEDFGVLSRLIDQFVSGAADGRFPVFGIKEGEGRHQEIDRLFWKSAAIDPLASMKPSNGGGVAETRFQPGARRDRYSALFVERAALEQFWPGVTTFNAKPEEEFLLGMKP